MKKLVCDRCEIEITDKDDIEMALEGREAWEAVARAKGKEPRGVIPCQNYVSCGGEMILGEDKKASWWRR